MINANHNAKVIALLERAVRVVEKSAANLQQCAGFNDLLVMYKEA